MRKKRKETALKLIGLVMAWVLLMTPLQPVFAAAKKAPTLSIQEITLVEGKSFNINITDKPKGASYRWTVVDGDVATVNEKNGIVTAVKEGTTNVYCRISIGSTFYRLKAKVNVLRPAVKVTITNPVNALEVNESYRLKADIIPKSSGDIVSWSSGDDSIIKVDQDGTITALKPGIATITATTVSERKDDIVIRVYEEGTKSEDKESTEATTEELGTDKSEIEAEDELFLGKGKTQKATMATRTSLQINLGSLQSGADANTKRSIRIQSSDSKVATVSDSGLIKALKPGKTRITLTVSDDSSLNKTIELTVLKDLTITKKHVDSHNEVIILDKSYGNLYIDTSVGSAYIYLAGVKVKNLLAMGTGVYSLYMYDSTVKELRIDDLPGEVKTFASGSEEERTPSLLVGADTQIGDLEARISAGIRREDGGAIENLRFTQSADGKITIYLDNYNGGLLLDASFGDMEIVTNGCNLSTVNVSGNENAGNILLVNGGNSEIDNLTVKGSANVNLGIPVNEVNIADDAQNVSLNSSESIGNLTNNGINSNITLSGSVANIETNGANGAINVTAGGNVGNINMNGEGTSLSGGGAVTNANVNANNCTVDTNNTLVTVGAVDGTKIRGKEAEGGTRGNSSTPAQGGASSPAQPVVAVNEVELDAATLWLKVNETRTVTATVMPENASNKTLTWSSSDTNVATVENGLIKAIGAGTATIRATAGGKTADCIVTVESAETDFEFDGSTGTITGYRGSGGTVVIPATIAGVAVEHIGYSAFVRIDYDTWDYVSNHIRSLIIPDTVKSIGMSAFYYSEDLESITIPDSVTEIGDYAFSNSHNLESIYIPKSVTDIGEGALSSCIKLSEIKVDEANSCYSDRQGVLFNKDQSTLVQYPAGKTEVSYAIPNSVITVGAYAFSEVNYLENVTFQEPSQVTTLDYYSFAYNSGLKSIIIPAGVTDIKDDAFYYAEKLETINVAESNTAYSDIDGVLLSKDKSKLIRYPMGKTDSSYKIPAGVVTIERYAFSWCGNLVNVSFEEGSLATTIRIGAFSSCKNLQSIVLAPTISDINEYAFHWCDKLSSITIGDGVSLGFDLLDNNNDIFKNEYLRGGAGTYTKGTDGSWTKDVSVIEPVVVTVSGAALTVVENKLTAIVEPADATNVSYQWQADTGIGGEFEDITGATAADFIITSDLIGYRLRVKISGGSNSYSIYSAETDVVQAKEL